MRTFTERIDLGDSEYKHNWELLMGDVYTVSPSEVDGGAINSNGYVITTAAGDGIVLFKGNTTTANGGAVYLQGATSAHSIENALFQDNMADIGSAIYSDNQTVNIKNSIFSGNTSTRGGALAINGSTVTIENSQFINNKAASSEISHGGAISVWGTSRVTLNNCYFSGNTAGSAQNGAIGINSATLIFQGKNILDTSSTINDRGIIYFDISGKTTSEGASEAVLNRFDNINNSNNSSLYLNVASDQRSDVYVIANNAGKAGITYTNFIIRLDMTGNQRSISVNGGKTNIVGSNVNYYLQKTANNDLILIVGDNFVFVNNSYQPWTAETTRTATYHGATFSGVEKDKRFFITFQDGVARAKEIKGKLIGVDAGHVTYSVSLECVSSELTSGCFDKLVIGGAIVKIESGTASTTSTDLMITGGTYNSNVIGGDYARDGKSAQMLQKSNLVITGGTFNYAVAAGSYANNNPANAGDGSVAVGDVSLTISGGTFAKRVYGGNYAYNDSATSSISNITGDVNILINVGDSPIVLNDGLDAGSRGTGAIKGNVTVTFKGTVKDSTAATSNLIFGEGAKIWGGCNRDTIMIMGDGTYKVSSKVRGDRLLLFDGFTDSAFEGKVAMFKSIKAVNNSQVTFACDALDTTIVENWTLGEGCSLEGLKKNDFTGDTLNLTYDGSGVDIVFSGADGALTGWNAATVILNGKNTEWSTEGQYWAAAEAGVKLYKDGNALKLAALA